MQHAGRYGIKAKFSGADWPAIRDRVFGRIDPLHDGAVEYRRENGIDVYASAGAFTGPGALAVGDDELRSARFVLAAGSRPAIPAWPGLDDVPYYTSDTIMRLKSAAEVDDRAGLRVHRRRDEPYLRLARHQDHNRDPRRSNCWLCTT